MKESEQALIVMLRGGDDKSAYALFKKMNAESAQSDLYYGLFDEFAALTSDAGSFVRTRGFSLCCAQARWDTEGKLARTLPQLLDKLRTEKPTAVRQCLKALHEVALYRSELCGMISLSLDRIDLSQFADSMAPLIEKDIRALKKQLD